MEGESEEETLKTMKQDEGFLNFCSENGLEIQEDVDGDVKAELGGVNTDQKEIIEEEDGEEEDEVVLVEEEVEVLQEEV